MSWRIREASNKNASVIIPSVVNVSASGNGVCVLAVNSSGEPDSVSELINGPLTLIFLPCGYQPNFTSTGHNPQTSLVGGIPLQPWANLEGKYVGERKF